MIYIFNMEIALVRIIDVLTDEISFAILGSDVEQFFLIMSARTKSQQIFAEELIFFQKSLLEDSLEQCENKIVHHLAGVTGLLKSAYGAHFLLLRLRLTLC